MTQTKAMEQNHFEENFAQLFEDSIREEKKEGTVVKGRIVAIRNGDAYIDVGLKSEGRIPLKEFATLEGTIPDLKVGDTVEVYIDRSDSHDGTTVLSRTMAIREESWFKFEELQTKEVNVDGIIIGRVKGGFAVDLNGLIAFLPGSQVDIRPIKDMTALMHIKQPFKILKMDRDQGNVVVSRRAILEESRAEARDSLLSTIKEGSILEGSVKNITDYGAFIDLGSIDGLLHITDISWNKISHPSEVLSMGQSMKVMVIKYNEETKRVSLGLKQLEKNPWDGFADKYKSGMTLKGTITTVTDYGAFVELEPGVEGLVYHTEISWNAKNTHPRKLVKPGDKVEVMVLELDISKHKISLSIRQCIDNPWKLFAQNSPTGSKVEGVIQNIADFGIFVLLNGDNPAEAIEALVPATELSWEEKPEVELKKYNKGDKLKAVVLNVDIDRERVSLGVRQLTEDKVSTSLSGFKKDDVVTCAVTAVNKDGIEVELTGGIKVFIKKNDLSKHKSEQRPERFGVGDKVDAKVTAIEAKDRKVSLSIKAYEVEEEKKTIAEYGSANSGASLGDILGKALAGKKAEKDAKATEEAPKKKATKAKAEEATEEKPKKAAAKKPAKKAE
jgi:small subunit ribosomal protein S1